MSDPIKAQLSQLEDALTQDAERHGEGPQSMTKSKFQSVMERKSFVTAYGQQAYDNLKD